MDIIQGTVDILQCPVYSGYITMYSVQCTVDRVHNTVYTDNTECTVNLYQGDTGLVRPYGLVREPGSNRVRKSIAGILEAQTIHLQKKLVLYRVKN